MMAQHDPGSPGASGIRSTACKNSAGTDQDIPGLKGGFYQRERFEDGGLHVARKKKGLVSP